MGYKTPTCSVATECGACELLSVPYPIQLERKQAQLEELFSEFDCKILPLKGMEHPLEYRAKVMTPFVRGRKGAICYGMYAKGTHRIIQAEHCLVEHPAARPILETIARLAKEFRIQPYNEDTGKGLLRHAVIRIAQSTGDVMVTLVINRREFPRKKDFVAALIDEHPEIVTVVFNVNTRQTNAVLGPLDMVAYGNGWLEDELCGCTFRIPASAFYQTNPIQTEVLYQTAVDMAAPKDGERVLDAYCGIGTIGIVAASQARPKHKKKAAKSAKQGKPAKPSIQLTGVESVTSAAAIASKNAKLNGITGAEFISGDAGEYMRTCAKTFDLVIMDPPRSGASEEFIDALLEAAPKRIVYISCNPVTQVRDIKALSEDYHLSQVVGVDMFPYTKHLESVALLTRKS